MASEGAARHRVDAELVRRGLVRSREEAREVVELNRVQVDGAPVRRPSSLVRRDQHLIVGGPPPRFVSRGGEKLQHALEAFGLEDGLEGARCLDAGISTGGFTDCLLQADAAQVLGFDVGYGQLAERLRRDPRVVLRERTNVRALTMADIGDQPVGLLVADLSFISLETVLPVLLPLVATDGAAILLCKPQFEVGRAAIGKGGIVRDPAAWRTALDRVTEAAAVLGWRTVAAVPSPIRGAAGNVEFLLHLRPDVSGAERAIDLDALLGAVVDAAASREGFGPISLDTVHEERP
jgi:23S rRNA (cytidine1920-2'-O)/16S rRNA (cytidine1409-2'-O)-methyltransferase